VCSVVKRKEVLEAVRQREDLTMIHGIGRVYGPALEAMGIVTWRDLMSSDSRRVLVGLKRKKRFFLSARQIEYWKRHARSYATVGPVAFGEGPVLPTSYIALDLEYTPPHIWLIGICIVRGGRRRFRSLWANGPASLKKNLKELNAILEAEPTLPLLTWGGTGADLPNLVDAIHRLLSGNKPRQGGWVEQHPFVAALWERHVDLYQYVWHGLRLPIPELGLKEVSGYFGIPRVSNVVDGLAAQMMYAQYREAKGAAKRAIRQQLCAYNRDDLEALIEVTGRVRDLMVSSEPIVLPAESRARVSKSVVTSKNQDVQPVPNGDVAWTRHLRSCTACWSAASGQDGYLSFCSVGLRLMDQLGG
jgi:predicted RecB family nuclease